MFSSLEAWEKQIAQGLGEFTLLPVGELMAVNNHLIFITVNKCSGQFLKLWESHYCLLPGKFLQTMLYTYESVYISKWKF